MEDHCDHIRHAEEDHCEICSAEGVPKVVVPRLLHVEAVLQDAVQGLAPPVVQLPQEAPLGGQAQILALQDPDVLVQILAPEPEMALRLEAPVLLAPEEQTLELAQPAPLLVTAMADNDNPALHWPRQ